MGKGWSPEKGIRFALLVGITIPLAFLVFSLLEGEMRFFYLALACSAFATSLGVGTLWAQIRQTRKFGPRGS